MFQKKKHIQFFLKKLSRPGPRKSKEKKKKKGNVIVPKKKKKEGNWMKPMCTCTWTFFSIKKKCIPTQFSLHFGEKTFWWTQRENTSIPPFIFLPFHPTKHSLKKFSFPFSLQSFPSTLFHLQTNTPLIMPLSVKAISYCPLLFAIDPSSLLQSNNGMPLPRTSKGCFQSENNF